MEVDQKHPVVRHAASLVYSGKTKIRSKMESDDMTVLTHRPFTAAACHVASVFLDTDATILKACALIKEASSHGAQLIAFPEAFVPAFPIWAALQAPILSHDIFRRLAAEAIRIPGPEIKLVQDAAKRHEVFVSIGVNEGTDISVGCIWNTNVLIGPDGEILNRHRKLVPTYFEKLVHARGDGAGLKVVDTEIGRIGALICGENTNPLARYTLMAQGEQIHVSTYPASWPTRQPNDDGAYDLERAIEIRAAAHSFEAKAFNIVTAGYADATMTDFLYGIDPAMADIVEKSPRGVSMVLDPTGSRIGDSLSDNEGIVYAEIDVSKCVEPKQFHDVVGYYNRFDVFQLNVNRSEHRPVRFDTDTPAEAAMCDGKNDGTATLCIGN